MRTQRLLLVLMGVALCAVALNATGTDYYIDPINGSDSNSGLSAEEAWMTLTHANGQTQNTGTEENPVVLHALAGVYSPSTNGETFPVRFDQGNFGGDYPRVGVLIGSGSGQTILDAERTGYVLNTWGELITVCDLTITGGSAGGVRANIEHAPGGVQRVTFERCVIRDNTGGDGLKVFNAGELVVTDCSFTGNRCSSSVTRGGAIAFELRAHTVTMTNCLIANNSVHHEGQNGGGIVFESWDTPTLINCTIAVNSPHGIYCLGFENLIQLYNCIVWGHQDDLLIEGGAQIDISHCNISDGDGCGENGNICEDPLFVSGPGGDEYLSHYDTEGADSPCIDAGDRPSADLGLDKYTTCTDGRPDTGTVDMGYHYALKPSLSNPTYSPDEGRTDTNFTFTIDYQCPTGEGPTSIEVFVNGESHGMTLSGGSAGNGTYSWTGTIDDQGVAQFHFEATGSTGMDVRHPSSGELDGPTVWDDYVKPQSSCTTDEITNTSTIDVDYTSSDDNSGVSNVALWMQYDDHGYYDSGQSSSDVSGSFTITLGSGEGTYKFYTIATDRAGNEESAPGTPDCSIVFDSTPPTSSASCDDSSNTSPIDVDFTASDALTGVQETALWYRYEGGSWTDSGQTRTGEAGTFTFDLADGEGTYEFYTVSTDVAGNTESAPGAADCSISYDCTAPESSCDCSRWVRVREFIYVWFEASDNLAGLDSIALWYRPLPSGSWTEYDTTSGQESGSFSFNLPGGVDDVEFYTIATDNAGNVEAPPGAADCELGYDAVKPQSSCTSPAVTNNTSIPVDFTASDDRSGVESTTLLRKYEDGGWGTTGLDPQTGTSGQFPFVAYLGDGTYYFATRALDNAGNQQDFPAEPDTETVLDTTAPVSSCSVDVEYTSAATISVQYSASDALTGVALVRLFVSRDGSAWDDTDLESDQAAGHFVYDFAGLDGTYRFVTVATDGAGNVESISAARACTVVCDTGLPCSVSSSPEVENDPTIEVAFAITDALSGAYGVELYLCFSTVATTACTGDWEYTGEYEYGTAGTISYEPAYGAGYYRFFTIARDKSGNTEEMKETEDCITDYNPDYVLSSCWAPDEASAATVAVDYATDIGEAGLDHVELWYKFSPDGADWPDEYLDSGVSSDAAEGTLVFEMPDGDGYYRFCTVALNEDLLAEPFPSACDCEVLVDATVPLSAVSGPSIAGDLPATVHYDASDQGQEGHFLSGVKSIEVWYSFEGSNTLYEAISGTPATIATGSVDFAPAQEGIYTLWSICTDAFGNREPTPPEPDMELAVDLAPPISSVSAPQYSTAFPVQVSVVATDAVTLVTSVSVYYSLDGGDWLLAGEIDASRGTLDFTPENVVEGVYGFISVGTDAAGHEESMRDVPDSETTVDWTAPQSSCTSASFSNSTSISVAYEASDGGSGVSSIVLYYKFGTGNWQDTGLTKAGSSGTFDFTASDGEGTYYFQTKAEDKAGNRESGPSGSGDDSTVLDATAPGSSATAPQQVTEVPFEVEFTASDDGSGVSETRLHYRFNGGSWQSFGSAKTGTSGSFEFTAPEGEGTYDFYTMCTDLAGNVETAPTSPDTTTIYHVPAPDISVQTNALNFGQVTIGEEKTETLTITNVGDGDLTITDVSADDSAFSVAIGGGLPASVKPGDSIDADVTFAPGTVKKFSADLLIASNDPDTPTLIVALTGEGVPGELTLEVTANSDTFVFGDTLQVNLNVENTGEPVTVDLYLVLTYDQNGPEERNWSASFTENLWTEGLAPLATDFAIDNGYAIDYRWWESTLPSKLPMISKSGTYTLRMAAFDAGTFDLASNLSAAYFVLNGEPFVNIGTDKGTYALNSDVVMMSLDVDVPYDLTADAYVVLLGPDGQFWSPTGFGEVPWAAEIAPMFSSITLPGGFAFSGPAFVATLPAAAPFNGPGQFTLFAGLVEPHTLTPFSDIGTASFSLQ